MARVLYLALEAARRSRRTACCARRDLEAEGREVSGKSVSLQIGALSDPVQVQLAGQGLRLPPNRDIIWQKRVVALTHLAVAGVVSDAERDRISRRIVKAIAREVTPL